MYTYVYIHIYSIHTYTYIIVTYVVLNIIYMNERYVVFSIITLCRSASLHCCAWFLVLPSGVLVSAARACVGVPFLRLQYTSHNFRD